MEPGLRCSKVGQGTNGIYGTVDSYVLADDIRIICLGA